MATLAYPAPAEDIQPVTTPALVTTPATTDDALLPVYRRAPMPFVGGAGVELFDTDGRAYLDFTSGIAVNALGYGDAGLAAAMHAAADGLVHVSNLFRTAPGEELAAKLVARTFADRVFFCNSGAEANEGAFKFARRWARAQGDGAKHEIVALRGSFHGRLFGTLAATDRPGYRQPFRPLAGGITIVERDLEELAAALSHDTVAAVILEPVQGESGVRVLDAGFLRGVRELTRRHGALLIFDEVQCGMGRTGRFLACEHADVAPDLLTLAKPLAGGLPMGAVLMTEAVAATIQPGDHGSTFGGGPFVAAVASHVVDRLSEPTLLAHVRDTGRWLGEALRNLAQRSGRVRAVRGVGFMWGVDVHEPAGQVVARARELGLLVVTAGDHTLRLLPPLVATREELARGLALLERAIVGDGA
jgi:acetylornithine/N-succinyldiaminopimelate aminotransferase